MTLAAKFSNKSLSSLKSIEDTSKQIADSLTPSAQNPNTIGTLPYYSSGARAFIRVGGRAIAVCQDFRWTVRYQTTPIQTIDTPFGWDLDFGSCTVNGNLSQIIDPTKGPEADNLFAIMKAAVHQPLVELQVLDATGTSLFYAKGAFVAVTGQVSKGAMSTLNAEFLGIGYQHYVSQNINFYNGIGASTDKITKGLKNLVSDLSGGVF